MCIQPPSKSLICPICQDLLNDPVITSQCHHSFCNSCLSQSLSFELQCPLCRTKLSKSQFHANLALHGLVQELLVHCPFHESGCPVTVRYENIQHHVENECLYTAKHCIYSQYGCDFYDVSIKVKEHLSSCPYHQLRAFINNTDQRLAHLETMVLEQQGIIKTLLKGKLSISNGTKASPTNDDSMDQQMPSRDISSSNESLQSQNDEIVAHHNWSESGMTCVSTISSLRSGITSLAHNNGTLFAGSYDGSVKIFDSYSGVLDRTFQGHQLSVWSLALDTHRNHLYSGSSDARINIWDLSSDSNTPIKTLNSDIGKIYGLIIRNNRIYTASSDTTITIWDLETQERLGSLQGHTRGVNSIKFYNDKLISASSDKSIKIWDLQTMVCENTLSHLSSEVLDISTGSNLLFGSTYDSNISAFNLNDYSRVGTLSGHKWEVWQLEFTHNVLFSGSHDHTIKRWDLRNFQNDITLTGHKGYIHGLVWGQRGLISGCADRTIKLWA
ncbi:WD40-repeat-containing domain protein [Globomyces pollinis-pini]|nr:WD40-repeat-containing domain protein [Globomyces pollinis-pini]